MEAEAEDVHLPDDPSKILRNSSIAGLVQLILGFAFLLNRQICRRMRREQHESDEEHGKTVPVQSEKSQHQTRLTAFRKRSWSALLDLANSLDNPVAYSGADEEVALHKTWQRARKAAFEDRHSIFCSHFRQEANFIKGNGDDTLEFPPSSAVEVEALYYSRKMLYRLFVETPLCNVMLSCFGCALISGALATFIMLRGLGAKGDDWLRDTGDRISVLQSQLDWFATFLLVGHLGFYVDRWRNFMIAAWSVEGHMKNVAMLVGSDVRDADDAASRSALYKIYRYLVVSLALQYRTILPSLHDMGDWKDLANGLQGLGLLTAEEAKVLVPATTRMRDVCLTWIGIEVNAIGPDKSNILMGRNTLQIMENLTAIRSNMMYFHGNKFYPQPNLYTAFKKAVVDTYCLLIIVAFPFQMSTAHKFLGLQPLVVFSVFIMVTCFAGFESLSASISKPFSSKIDTFNIDSLIAGTEQTCFANLRASFHRSITH